MKESKSGFLYKVWNILMPLVIYYAVYLLSFFLLSYLYQIIVERSGVETAALLQEQKTTLTGIVNGISMLLGALVLVPLLRVELQEHRGRITSCGQQDDFRQKTGMLFLITILLAISSSIGLNVLLSLTGLVQNSASYQDVAQSQYGVAFGVGVVLYAVVSPVAEEIVFRGIIYNRMRRYLGEWKDKGLQNGRAYLAGMAGYRDRAGLTKERQVVEGAKRQASGSVEQQMTESRKWSGSSRFDASVTIAVIASGVLFGVYHGNLVQGIYGGCMGILMAYLYERTHAFYIPCLFHATANCVVYVLAQNAALHERIFTFPWCAGLLAISMVMILIVEKGKKGYSSPPRRSLR